jgi:hypothetical protein
MPPLKKVIATTIAWLLLAGVGFLGTMILAKLRGAAAGEAFILPVLVTIAGLVGAIITLIKGLGH